MSSTHQAGVSGAVAVKKLRKDQVVKWRWLSGTLTHVMELKTWIERKSHEVEMVWRLQA